jgi:hypothetical protein
LIAAIIGEFQSRSPGNPMNYMSNGSHRAGLKKPPPSPHVSPFLSDGL